MSNEKTKVIYIKQKYTTKELKRVKIWMTIAKEQVINLKVKFEV